MDVTRLASKVAMLEEELRQLRAAAEAGPILLAEEPSMSEPLPRVHAGGHWKRMRSGLEDRPVLQVKRFAVQLHRGSMSAVPASRLLPWPPPHTQPLIHLPSNGILVSQDRPSALSESALASSWNGPDSFSAHSSGERPT